MNIKLYNTTSDPRALSKRLTDEIQIACQVTDELNVDSPVFLLDLTNAKINRNYAFVPEWNRYYFLAEPVIVNGHHVEIQGSIDDLMTHRSAILNSQVIADRSASNFEYYMEDSEIISSGRIVTKTRKLPTVFNTANVNNNYVIILGGR